MRTKELTMDGEKVTIAPLTFAQAAYFSKKYETITGTDGKMPVADAKAVNMELVCASVNRVTPKALDSATIENDWDLPWFLYVYSEILKFSGTKSASVGEAVAAG